MATTSAASGSAQADLNGSQSALSEAGDLSLSQASYSASLCNKRVSGETKLANCGAPLSALKACESFH